MADDNSVIEEYELPPVWEPPDENQRGKHQPGWSCRLTKEDLERLRTVVRKILWRGHRIELSDYEADRLIDAYGPDALEKHIKGLTDSGLIKTKVRA